MWALWKVHDGAQSPIKIWLGAPQCSGTILSSRWIAVLLLRLVHYLRQRQKVVVLLDSVCLPVCYWFLKKLWTDFDECFWMGGAWPKDKVIKVWWRSVSGFRSRNFLKRYTVKPGFRSLATTLKLVVCCWRTLSRKEQLWHRVVSLRQHGFLVKIRKYALKSSRFVNAFSNIERVIRKSGSNTVASNYTCMSSFRACLCNVSRRCSCASVNIVQR